MLRNKNSPVLVEVLSACISVFTQPNPNGVLTSHACTVHKVSHLCCVSKGKPPSVMLIGLDITSNSRLVKQQFVWLLGTLERLSCPGSTACWQSYSHQCHCTDSARYSICFPVQPCVVHKEGAGQRASRESHGKVRSA